MMAIDGSGDICVGHVCQVMSCPRMTLTALSHAPFNKFTAPSAISLLGFEELLLFSKRGDPRESFKRH